MFPTQAQAPSRTTRWVVGICCAVLAGVAMLPPVACHWIPVLAGLGAALAAAAAAVRGGGVDRWAWALFAAGQLTSCVVGGWQPSGGLTPVLYDSATVLTVAGLWTLLSPTRNWRTAVGYGVDWLAINASAFVMVWSLPIGAPFGQPARSSALAEVALATNLLAVLLLPLLWRSRPRGHRAPVLLAWLAVAVAMVGDATLGPFAPTGDVAPGMVATLSSLLILFGATFVSREGVLQHPMHRTLSLFTALACVATTAVVIIWAVATGVATADGLTAAVLSVAVVLAALRFAQLEIGNSRRRRRLVDAVWTDPLTGLPTGAGSRRCSIAGWRRPDRPPCCSATSTGSRRSTTPTATGAATSCWSASPTGSPAR